MQKAAAKVKKIAEKSKRYSYFSYICSDKNFKTA